MSVSVFVSMSTSMFMSIATSNNMSILCLFFINLSYICAIDVCVYVTYFVSTCQPNTLPSYFFLCCNELKTDLSLFFLSLIPFIINTYDDIVIQQSPGRTHSGSFRRRDFHKYHCADKDLASTDQNLGKHVKSHFTLLVPSFP